MNRSPHLSVAHNYWKDFLHPGDIAIDATCGNGHDIEILAKILLPHPKSLLIALDLQQIALNQTEQLLKKTFSPSLLTRVLFHRRCHSDLASIPLPTPARLIVYNLGYLPGGDKSITTKTATTLESLNKAAVLLADDGALSVTCYPGHDEGAIEEKAILEWAQKLPSSHWQVCHHRWINREAAPSLFWLKRIGLNAERS